MIAKITVTTIFLFTLLIARGQDDHKDSVKSVYTQVQRDSIIKVLCTTRDSLKKELRSIWACDSFFICTPPKWAKKKKGAKCFIKNCDWSSTYIVLNKDATFLYEYQGEGAHYLQKGSWSIAKNILILKGDYKASLDFKKVMKNYSIDDYMIRQKFYMELFYTQKALWRRDSN